jgi:hypothetical protein
MQAGGFRWPLRAAGLAVIAAMAVAGCATGSSSAAKGGSTSAAPVSAVEAVKLASQTTGKVNSFTATMDIQITVPQGTASSTGLGSGSMDISATLAERLRPTLLMSMTLGSFSTGGTSLPGGLTELITPTALYMKWSYLTQQMHLTKPWLEIPLSALGSKSGVNLSQLLNQASGNGPLTQSQMLAGATSVREVGTGTVGGVPVTEYTGTVPLDKAMSYLSGSAKTTVQQLIASGGLTTEKFTVWIDGQHQLRKAIITMNGKALSETVNMTVTSINQPITVTVPPASETTQVPASALG